MKKIAVLTSGGDSPGINACLTWLLKACHYYQIEPYFVFHGYQGLVENKIELANKSLTDSRYFNGGTAIYTSRFPEFKEKGNYQKAVQNLKNKKIETLVVLGGNGSFQGANLLAENGLQVIGIPSTIDNNIKNTSYSVGFFTAVETVGMTIKNLRETAESHNRCYIIETMGDNCGELTKYAAIASNADIFSTPEHFLTIETITKKVKLLELQEKRSVIIVITEKMYSNYEDLVNQIQAETNYLTRFYSVSFLQRGGNPSAIERYNDAVLGSATINFLTNNSQSSGAISLKNNQTFEIVSFNEQNQKIISLTLDDQELQEISCY